MLEASLAGRPKSRAKKNRALATVPSSDALDRLKKALVECGIEPRRMERFVARLRGRPLSAKGGLRLDDGELVAWIDERLACIFEYIDAVAFSRMTGRDLMVAFGILIDKRQILRGQPTAITKREDVVKLEEFLEQVSKELKLRGEGPEVIDVTPAPVENAGMS